MTIDKENVQLSDLLIEFYETLFSWETAVAKTSGLTPQQNHTIEIVGNDGPIRMKPLAEKLSVTMGTLTVMIDRLETGGYLKREKDPEDGRGYIIQLTRKGGQIHNEHHAYHLKLSDDILHALDPEETRQFIDLLKKINGVF